MLVIVGNRQKSSITRHGCVRMHKALDELIDILSIEDLDVVAIKVLELDCNLIGGTHRGGLSAREREFSSAALLPGNHDMFLRDEDAKSRSIDELWSVCRQRLALRRFERRAHRIRVVEPQLRNPVKVRPCI